MIVCRLLISSASLVSVRYLLNSLYSGCLARMSVMLWALAIVEMKAKKAMRKRCRTAMVELKEGEEEEQRFREVETESREERVNGVGL